MNNKPKILFEDKNLAVLSKPANLTVHPTSDNDNQFTLVDYITETWPETKNHNWLDPKRIGIVHRLDKDTSGLIVIAKNPKTLKFLQDQFRSHTTKKKYTLLCVGETDPNGKIITQTTRDSKKYNKQKTSLLSFSWQKGKAREAITTYKTIKHYYFDNQILSLVKATIKTGRTHQIRNHFKFINHPIIGDQMYFTKKSKDISNKLNLYRQFLHSSRVEFNLPSGKIKSIISALQKDLKEVLELLKEDNKFD